MQVPVRLYKSLLPLMALMLLSSVAWANPNAQGYCAQNGQVVISGLKATNTALLTYPRCTVTVSIHGGGLATLYSDNLATPTPLDNPFTANADASWKFYAAAGEYDITLTGGTPLVLPSPVVYSDVVLGTGGGALINALPAVADPWMDMRPFGLDCTGAADSRVALVSALTSGNHRLLVPPGCKLKVQASGGLGAVALGVAGLPTGWIDIYGSDGAEIFGCGNGSGAVLKFDRSGYFKFHGVAVQLTDFTYCPGGSTFTRMIDWTNNGVGGTTSTKARFYDLQLSNTGLRSGGNWFVTVSGGGVVADAGNLVAYVDATPSWTNLGIHQETATAIANGTVYTLNAREALGNINFDSGYRTSGAAMSVNLTANGVIVATTACTPALAAWNTCTVQYTGTAGTNGQTLGVTLLNTSTVAAGGLQAGNGNWSRVFFDNLTSTNFAVTNPSFETLLGGATLSSGANLIPTVGANWTWVQGAASYPQNVGLQVGAVNGESNLEGFEFYDSVVDGRFEPNSYGEINIGCCSEHNVFSNLLLSNIWRGLYGNNGGTMIAIHGGGGEGTNQFNYQAFGLPPYGVLGGGGLIVPGTCPVGLAVISPTSAGMVPAMAPIPAT
jgi:hypothetical protein